MEWLSRYDLWELERFGHGGVGLVVFVYVEAFVVRVSGLNVVRGSGDGMGWGCSFVSDEMGTGFYVGESVRHVGLMKGVCRFGRGGMGSGV